MSAAYGTDHVPLGDGHAEAHGEEHGEEEHAAVGAGDRKEHH
jgi:ubiquinol-cytochrome c reductase cytochrome b subunit